MNADPRYLGSLWRTVLRGGRVAHDSAKWPRFSGALTHHEDGSLEIALDERWDVHLDRSASRALGRLSTLLHERFGLHIIEPDLRTELLREVGRILVPGAELDTTLDSMLERFTRYTSTSVVVVPFGGMYSSLAGPVELGQRACIGHVSTETEGYISTLARRWGLDGFRFTDEAWWTEQFMGAETDPHFAAELAEIERNEGSWQPMVLAVVLNQVGTLAAFNSLETAEAVLGAILVFSTNLDQPFPDIAPWILGTATITAHPRSPVFGDDRTLPTAPLQVDSLPGRSYRAVSDISRRPYLDLDLAPLLSDTRIRAILTRVIDDPGSAWEVAFGRRLACRLALWAHNAPQEVAVPLLQRAVKVMNLPAAGPDPLDEYLAGNIAILDLGTQQGRLLEELADVLLSDT